MPNSERDEERDDFDYVTYIPMASIGAGGKLVFQTAEFCVSRSGRMIVRPLTNPLREWCLQAAREIIAAVRPDESWRGLKLTILEGLLEHEHFYTSARRLMDSIIPKPLNDYQRAVIVFSGLHTPPSIEDEVKAFCEEWRLAYEFSPWGEPGVRISRGCDGWPEWAKDRAQAISEHRRLNPASDTV